MYRAMQPGVWPGQVQASVRYLHRVFFPSLRVWGKLPWSFQPRCFEDSSRPWALVLAEEGPRMRLSLQFLLMTLFWFFPKEPPKFPVVPILSSSFMDTNLESLYSEVNVPFQGSCELRPPPTPPPLPHILGSQEGGHSQDTGQPGESVEHRSSSLKGDSPLVKGSLGHVESGLEDILGNTDRGTLCSTETNFESNMCVCNFSIELSQAMLERSAQSHSLLKMASPSLCTSSFDKGTMRRMALSMIE